MFQCQADLPDQGQGHQTWFKFEGKIPNDSKVIVFKRNHTHDDAN